MVLTIWTEKYRPQKLEEVVNQTHVVSRLKAWVESKSIPNMLFAGSAGVGKTTVALCLAREIFGKEWKENFLELNASDERGIDVVRGRIKDFAMIRPLGHDFKIIFLDEADALTAEAQQALRRTMEKYSNTTRFILSCNYSSKIIPPIQSRCAIFRFKPLPKDTVIEMLIEIAAKEKYLLSWKAAELIYEASEGDMRKAENLLQACASVAKKEKGSIDTPFGKKYETEFSIDPSQVSAIVSFAEPNEIEAVVKLAIS